MKTYTIEDRDGTGGDGKSRFKKIYLKTRRYRSRITHGVGSPTIKFSREIGSKMIELTHT